MNSDRYMTGTVLLHLDCGLVSVIAYGFVHIDIYVAGTLALVYTSLQHNLLGPVPQQNEYFFRRHINVRI